MRKKLYSMLGNLPSIDRQPFEVSRKVIKRFPYIVEELVLDLNGIEQVPALFLKPRNQEGKVLPLVIYNHSHGSAYNIGKKEVMKWKKSFQFPSYGDALVKQGYSVLCIDHWAFGDRNWAKNLKRSFIQKLLGRANSSESYLFKYFLWQGQTLWGMMLYDNIKALDYAITREDIDPERVATLGMSMGSTMAWWHAALDQRIKVCVDICCLTDFHTFLEKGDLEKHGIYYYVPDLVNHFSTSDINSLIAPRAHLALAGVKDPLTPEEGLMKIDRDMKLAYGKSDAWQLKTFDTGHKETPQMRQETLKFLQKWL